MTTKIEISTSTLVRIALFLLGVWFLFAIRDVLVLLFLVLIIVAGLSPTVDRWAKTITRPGAVVSVFVIIFVLLGMIFSLIIPPFIDQLQQFSANLPAYTEKLSQQPSGFLSSMADVAVRNINQISSYLSNIGEFLFTRTVGVVSGVVAVITVIVLSFYLLLEEDGLRRIYKGILPAEWHGALAETTRKITGKLGSWVRGQLLLMLIVGVLITLGLLIVGSDYALSLGVWAGLTEVVPILGPWLGAIPGVIVGLVASPLQGFLVLIVYIIVQQLEGNIIVPKVMSKAVGLNPFIVILAILVGGKLYGLMGILLGVPMAAVISVIAEDWQVIRHTFGSSRKS
ncbi:hypothetical protein A3A71_03945 [Candidatus Berkelbacteria bacterium RIFCSPLOWO2_01_FULL_50_28]|uniref:AI-2E family transporter n=1 Tax=Candidatus Berkelbacteria bacterium RIFCSPLOWO2_01_FULL_50_28 TaxID=1797471 RepID=A0A1F5EAA8_9BACT|nr:MAG: hypothetical protein A3F39_01310 [Candidatus Berkelbacteria bacterium RIFCSPHIGHO2_12_FULL_50_11]OGD64293.1 MAG: hypothetical protein A3A71_03945 [Candidatus Berkelbacteria bacterium RIFCSPLOWO2_01_FULL_50_28]